MAEDVSTDRPDLAARLEETAARVPDAVAFSWSGGERTYAELAERVARASGGLAGLGVGPGDRVALLLGNCPEFVEALLATLRLGATVVPMNPFLAPPEVAHILGDSGARVLVVPAGAPALDSADRPDTLEHVVTTARDGDGGRTWEDVVASEPPATQAEREPDDVAALVYTSGTTGRPKGAMLTRRNLASNQDQVLSTPLGVRDDDVILAVLPLFHIYALNVALGSAVRVGARLVLVDRFDPVATLETIRDERITVLLGAPPMYVAWLATPGIDASYLETVRVAVSGAAPLPGPVLERFRDELGLTIWEGYGLTEAAPAVTSTAMGGVAKPGYVGLPLPDVDIRLVDDNGRDVEPGDPGEVWVRGPNVFAGYWNDPEATAEVITSDGWLRTGDVGVLDEEGYLRLVDRKRDLIIVSGFNVYPREVENAIHEHPDVADVAAVGVPHPYTGEAVKVFVVPRPGATLEEGDVDDWARRRLARFKCPEVVRIVDELPYTATGKVKRRELRS